MTVTDAAAGPGLDAKRPWPGLDAFSEALSPFFFGREAETEELFRRVRHDPVTLLFGRSGLGKTSLLQAGLFPKLRAAGFLPVIVRLDFTPRAPGLGAQVKAIIEHACAERGVEATPISADESLWDWFHRADRRLAESGGRDLVPVLVFDQFEEIFTLGLEREASRTASQTFLIELADLIENRPTDSVKQALADDPDAIDKYQLDRDDYRIVIALREDYLAPLEGLRARAPSLGRNRYRLRRMNGRQALDAILNPAPGLIAPDLAGEIIRFIGRADPEDVFGRTEEDAAAGYEVEPVFLSLVCSELNELRLARGLAAITTELFEESRETIIDGFYERALAGQPAAVRALIEDELLSESGFRESVSVERARRTLAEAGVPAAALDELVRRRLLRIEERLDVARVEIIHDVLAPVIRRSRDTRHLRQAEAAAAARDQELRQERRRARRAYWIAAAMALLALLTIISAGFGYFAFRSIVEARREALGAEQQRRLAEEQRALAEQQRDAAENEKQRDVAINHDKVGAMLEAQGNLTGALTEFRAGLEIRQRLTQQNPSELGVQRELAANHSEIGDVLQAQGVLAGAAAEYRDALAIQKILVGQQPDNAVGQRDLSASLDKIGDVLRMQGDLPGALAAYRESLPVMERLAAQDTGNVALQRDVSLGHDRMGAVLRAEGDFSDALVEYRASLGIAQHLADIDPSNIGWQRDLAISHEQVSGVLLAQRDLAAALAECRADLTIALSLAEKHPGDAGLQRDLSIAHNRVGDVLDAQGDLAGALVAYQAALAITQRLAEQDASARWNDLLVSYTRLGQIAQRQGDVEAALEAFRAAEKFALRLRELNPGAPEGISDLAWVQNKLLETLKVIAHQKLEAGDAAGAIAAGEERVAVARRIYAAAPTDDAKTGLANALGVLSWDLTLDKRAQDALDRADEALSLDPSLLFVQMNRAHALLLLGRFDEAKAIYAANKNTKFGDGKTFAQVVAEDFAEMRKFGIDIPDMKRIEALLAN